MKIIFKYSGINWGVCIEFKLEDMWIGLFWKHKYREIDIWLCLIPCFPIHYWSGREKL